MIGVTTILTKAAHAESHGTSNAAPMAGVHIHPDRNRRTSNSVDCGNRSNTLLATNELAIASGKATAGARTQSHLGMECHALHGETSMSTGLRVTGLIAPDAPQPR